MKIRSVVLLAGVFVGVVAGAAPEYKTSLYGGLNSSEFKTSNSGSYDRDFGYDFGSEFIFDFGQPVKFRTGAGIAKKNSTLKFGTFKIDVEFMYLEVPVTALFQLNESIGLFGGLNFDLKISDECGGSGVGTCKVQDPESLVYNLVLGGRYNISGQHNIVVPLEIGMSDMFKDTKLANSLGVRYAYQFN